MKYFDIKRNKFSTILKNINFHRYNFSKISKFINLKRFNFNKLYGYFDIRQLNFYIKNKKFILNNFKHLSIYIFSFLFFSGLVYTIIPVFYSYDKSEIEKAICQNKNIECLIKGKINYSFYPTPRIKIKDLVINSFLEKKDTLLEAKNVVITLSLKNLLIKMIFNNKIKFV